MKSTLVELPPEISGLEEDSFVEAQSVEELAEKTQITGDDRIERLFLPGHRVGPYKILGYVASGGMGEVYAAERIMEDGRRLGPVGLKVIAPEYTDDWQITERFKREARISHGIRSRHVTRVYEFGEDADGFMFLAMELLTGEELFDRLYSRRQLPEKEVADLTLQILAGLRAVHGAGFIHRDLKPENVYLARQPDGTEVVKIIDFGIAKVADEESNPYLSVVGKVYGTPEYIAPEQGLNPDVDERADLYSVGVIMYETLTGCLPFDGETPYAIILAHQNEPVPSLPSTVDPELAQIVLKALEKKPGDRFQSAEEMSMLLRVWLEEYEGDGLGSDLRESNEFLGAPGPGRASARRESPVSRAETPQHGLPPVDTGEHAQRNLAAIGLEEVSAPPVQIFSVPKKQKKSRSQATPAPPEPSPTAATPDPAAPEIEPGDSRAAVRKGSSLLPTLVTAVAVIVILAAVAWAVWDANRAPAEAVDPPPPTSATP